MEEDGADTFRTDRFLRCTFNRLRRVRRSKLDCRPAAQPSRRKYSPSRRRRSDRVGSPPQPRRQPRLLRRRTNSRHHCCPTEAQSRLSRDMDTCLWLPAVLSVRGPRTIARTTRLTGQGPSWETISAPGSTSEFALCAWSPVLFLDKP